MGTKRRPRHCAAHRGNTPPGFPGPEHRRAALCLQRPPVGGHTRVSNFNLRRRELCWLCAQESGGSSLSGRSEKTLEDETSGLVLKDE